MKDEITISNGIRVFILALAGLLSAGLLHGLVFAIISINNLDFSGCNTIINPQSIASEWYYSSMCLLVLSVLLFLILIFFKGTPRILSFGILLSAIYPLIIFLKVYPDHKESKKYFKEFDQQEWNKSAYKSLPVARWLDHHNEMSGKTHAEILKILGDPSAKTDSVFRYELEFPGIFFEVYTDGNKAVKDTIKCYL